ncbi:hypothetical protein CRUP_031627 [Coryphaenoides rupestris]|nr:hypothetical protein CRUP_031627 [Coryphaenoides rupestris]
MSPYRLNSSSNSNSPTTMTTNTNTSTSTTRATPPTPSRRPSTPPSGRGRGRGLEREREGGGAASPACRRRAAARWALSPRHCWARRFTLREFALEQERGHRRMLRHHLRQEKLNAAKLKGL